MTPPAHAKGAVTVEEEAKEVLDQAAWQCRAVASATLALALAFPRAHDHDSFCQAQAAETMARRPLSQSSTTDGYFSLS